MAPVDKALVQYEADISQLQAQLKGIETRLGGVEAVGAKSAKGLEKSFGIVEGSLADLEDGLKKIEIQIKRTTDPKQLNELGKSFKVQKKLVDESRKSIEKLTGQTKSAFSGLGKQVLQLGTIFAGAFSVSKLVSFGIESVKLAAKAEGITEAFERLDDPKLLDDIRKATRGTVSDIELMQRAVQAKHFKIPLEKLGTFFEFATKRAAQTGESVDFLVDSIVKGIGRKSTLVLDNLGISAVELQEEIKKTGDFGEAAGIIIQREIGKAGDVTLTTAQRFAQTQATIENLKVEIGTELIPVVLGLLGTFNELIVSVKRIGAGIKEVFGERTELEKFNTAMTGTFKSVKDLLSGIDDLGETEIRSGEATRNFVKLLESENTTRDRAIKFVNFALNQRLKEIKLSKEAGKGKEEETKRTLKAIDADIKAQKELFKLTSTSQEFAEVERGLIKLQEERAAITGKETEAQKKARLEAEKRAKEEEKRLKERLKLEEEFAKRNQKAALKIEEFKAQLDVQAAETVGERVEKEIKLAELEAENKIELTDATANEQELIEKELQDNIKKIREKGVEDDKKLQQERLDKIIQGAEEIGKLLSGLNDFANVLNERELSDLEAKNEERLEMIEGQDEAEQEALAFKLDNRLITEQEAENLKEEQQEIRDARNLQLQEQFEQKANQIKRRQAIRDKLLAIFNIGISTASAIAKTIGQTGFFGIPLAIIAGALGAVQLATVLATPLPAFKKGTKGKKDSGLAMVGEEGPELRFLPERTKILPADKTKSNDKIIDAMFDNKLDSFINQQYVLPALRKVKAKQDHAFADRILKNMSIQSDFDDYRIVKAIKKGDGVSVQNTRRIVKALKDNDASFQNYIRW